MAIMIKTPAEIEKMRHAGQILRQVHEFIRPFVVVGATTMDLEVAANKKMQNRLVPRLRSRGTTAFRRRCARR